jgi:hypothetical protein
MSHPYGLFSGDEIERRLENARNDRSFYIRGLLARGGKRLRSRKLAVAGAAGAALLGLTSFASLRPAGPVPPVSRNAADGRIYGSASTRSRPSSHHCSSA